MTAPSPARQRIDALLRAHRLVLFMRGTPDRPEFGASMRAWQALGALGLELGHADVEADPELGVDIENNRAHSPIPRLYLDGKLLASGDNVERMVNTGEVHAALGLPAPERRPPAVRLTAAAAKAFRAIIRNSPRGSVAEVVVDPQYCCSLEIEPRRPDAILAEVDGVPLQFDLASAQRGDGLEIHWQDVERGPSVLFEHPKASVPVPVRAMSPAQAAADARAGKLTIVDIRSRQERASAPLSVPFLHMDDGTHEIRNLPADAPLAVLCERGVRSVHAAQHFHQMGHLDVYYIEGGFEAWSGLANA
ncbi:rhodanese-like domain-containing protein [Pseudomonas sp. CGJS7]|uniref:rhodanese-like domain-containing protein n=1 Tax=Pseudomonas sp. CGJS7 TaxID=3109348 RepID=UPI00300B427B